MGLPLAASDESNRLGIQLYHRVASQADLNGKQVLEVSCGHGGGASYLVRTVRPASYKGKAVYVYADPTICGCLYMGGTTAYNTYIQGAIARNMQQEYKSDTTDSGYNPTAAMLDGGPWDDAEMYGLYIN